jgi:hypothetical protein
MCGYYSVTRLYKPSAFKYKQNIPIVKDTYRNLKVSWQAARWRHVRQQELHPFPMTQHNPGWSPCCWLPHCGSQGLRPHYCTNLLELLLTTAAKNQLHRAQSFFKSYLSLSHSRISHLIESESSLQYSQELSPLVPILKQVCPVHTTPY